MQITSDAREENGLAQALYSATQVFKYAQDKDFNANADDFAKMMKEFAHDPDVSGSKYATKPQEDNVVELTRKQAPKNAFYGQRALDEGVHNTYIKPIGAIYGIEQGRGQSAANAMQTINSNLEYPFCGDDGEHIERGYDDVRKKPESFKSTSADFVVFMRKAEGGIVLGIVSQNTRRLSATEVASVADEVRKLGHKLVRVYVNGRSVWDGGYPGSSSTCNVVENGTVLQFNQQW